MNEPEFAAQLESITGMPSNYTHGEQPQEKSAEHEQAWLEYNELEAELRQDTRYR